MDHKHNQRPATSAYWASCDRLPDGDTVRATTPPQRGTIWKLLALAPGLLLIGAVIAWTIW